MRNFVTHFILKLFKIMQLIKESNPKGVGERVFTAVVERRDVEVLNRMMVLVVNSNPNNYGRVMMEEGEYLEVSLEELKKF